MTLQVRFARSARKHRIGKSHALEAFANTELVGSRRRPDGRWTHLYVGIDRRGVELEIGAAHLADGTVLIVHVMPTHYRRGN